MRKIILKLLMLCLVLTFAACRPAGESTGAGDSPEATNTDQSETQQAGGSDALSEQEDETTVSTNDETEDETVQSAESETQTDEPVTGEGGTETQDENGTPTDGHTHTQEDPAIRTRAEQIRTEQGFDAYYDYCKANDITVKNVPLVGDFQLQAIRVILKKSCSSPGGAAPDFSCVDPVSVTDITMSYIPLDDYRQTFEIIVSGTTQQDLSDAMKILEQHECVFLAAVFGVSLPS